MEVAGDTIGITVGVIPIEGTGTIIVVAVAVVLDIPLIKEARDISEKALEAVVKITSSSRV